MENFKNITVSFINYGMGTVDVSVSDQLTAHQLFMNLVRDLGIKKIELANIGFKVERTSDILTQQEVLSKYDIRSGDVLILL